MVKHTLDQIGKIGLNFLTYLEDNGLLKTCAKPELKEIYERKFKVTQQRRVPCFSSVLYVLFRRTRMLVVTNGYIYFKGTDDWKNRKDSTKLRFLNDNVSQQEHTEILKVMKEIRTAGRRDDFLKSSNFEITCDPPELESSPGYVTLDLREKKKSSFVLHIKNISEETYLLKKCLFLRKSTAMTLSDQFGCTLLTKNAREVEIPPGADYKITVNCQINEKVGSYCSDLFFRFSPENSQQSHLVMRYLRTFRSNDIVELLKPTEPYKRMRISRDNNIRILRGERLMGSDTANKLQMTRQLPYYHVTPEICSAYDQRIFSRDVATLNDKDKQLIEELSDDLDFNTYRRKFSTLLQLEEKQAEHDIHFYDINGAKLEREGNRFRLKVPGLSERRPSVLKGDRIFLRLASGQSLGDIKYEGYVHQVELNSVLLGLHQNFKQMFMDGMKFNVSFTFNRLTVRLQHRAVENLTQPWIKKILFPDASDEDVAQTNPELRIYNAMISNNEEQLLAIKAIVHGRSRVPYIIFGPPGTGKTVTMVEAIKQVAIQQKKRVLICAPSNSACDLLVDRLLQHVGKNEIFRMHAMTRPWRDVPDKVKEVSNYDASERDYYYPTKENLQKYYILATTLVTAGRLSSANFPTGHFDYIFVDEAGHAVEPECMIAVDCLLNKTGRLVLAGDPKQLGPVLRSKAAVEYGLAVSYLERLMENQDIYQQHDEGYDHHVITKLLKNYRSHKAILEIPNECFYDNELKEEADPIVSNQFCSWKHLPKPEKNFPVIFHGVKGKDEREANSPSYFNAEEASVVSDVSSNETKASV
ncbi:unnamed protein product [Clavelina lepadiformis]|uniref:RNA helicase n=1 Tax=Clavelina lepadiformis TaxID=159417 RepID=A0ABP0G4Q4_CLALP